METSVDFEKHLIQVPSVARPRRLVAQAISVSLTELKAPFSDSLKVRETPRIANISSTSRKLNEKRKYNQTQ